MATEARPLRRTNISRYWRNLSFWNLVTVGAFALLLLFLVYPLLAVFQQSLTSKAGDLLDGYRKFFTQPYYSNSLTNSLLVSIPATIGSLLIGVPLAYVVTRYTIPGRALIRSAVVMTLLSPPFIGAYAWVVMLGRAGLLNQFLENFDIQAPSIYGPGGLIFVFTITHFPFVFLVVSSAIRSIDQSIEDAARNLGSGEVKTFFTVLLPILFPSITAGVLLAFMTIVADFGTPMIIGESFRVLPTQIYGEFINEMGGNPTMASAMSVILILICLLALTLQRYFAAKMSYNVQCVRPLETREPHGVSGVLMTAFACLVIFVSLLPIVIIFFSSFTKGRGSLLTLDFSLANYERILYNVPTAITNTFFLATLSASIGIVLAMFIAYILVRGKTRMRGLLDSLVNLPMAIPGTVLAVGFIIVFNQPPLLLTGTWMILVVSYVVRRLPYAVRACVAMLQQIDASIEEASVNLGVPPMRTFARVVVPLMAPAILAGGIMTWVMTISELSSTILLYYGPFSTMTVQIFNNVFSNQFGNASALSMILITATFVPLFLMYRFLGEHAEQIL
ncbi:MAG: iron ABC transporter permease [Chloroflexi bacterium]|nr:iron ABC transporter permease [Chloroflexota bacterium]